MRYLTIDDLSTDIYMRFINESAEKPPGEEGEEEQEPPVLAELENRAIALVSTYLTGRYDVAKIFDDEEPVRNELIVDILSRIIVYRLIKRNAARKVPTDAKEDYDAAIKQLESINSGRIKLEDLPKPTDESGNQIGKNTYGNNSNPDFYI